MMFLKSICGLWNPFFIFIEFILKSLAQQLQVITVYTAFSKVFHKTDQTILASRIIGLAVATYLTRSNLTLRIAPTG